MEMQPNTNDMSRDGITASELARAYQVAVSTIWRLKRTGRIPFFQPGGKRGIVRFPPNAFEFGYAKAGRDESVLAASEPNVTADDSEPGEQSNHLSGPRPQWMKQVRVTRQLTGSQIINDNNRT